MTNYQVPLNGIWLLSSVILVMHPFGVIIFFPGLSREIDKIALKFSAWFRIPDRAGLNAARNELFLSPSH